MTALDLLPEELADRLQELGMPGYRGEQVFRALQQGGAASWGEITALRQADREQLAGKFALEWPEVAQRYESVDGTIRYLLRLADGAEMEAVYLPDEEFDLDWRGPQRGVAARPAYARSGFGALSPDAGAAPSQGKLLHRRTTFCISTQVGCAVGCQFCLTATLGLKRNLTAAEIVGQVLTLLRLHELRPGKGLDRVNLVFMGMGEPFLNYDAVVRAIRVLCRPEGAGLAARRITISTSGIVDKIRRWGQEEFPQGRPRLAISLNASSDEQRQRLMPLNRGQGGITGLLDAVRGMPLGRREYVTFEYVLLAGVNDSDEDAERVLALLQGIPSKVNLIAWNRGPELPFTSPQRERVLAFQRRLLAGGKATYIRRPRGQDVYAACGQLSKRGHPASHPKGDALGDPGPPPAFARPGMGAP